MLEIEKNLMADDWEDWEDESFEPKLQSAAANGQQFETKGQAVLAGTKDSHPSKFAGEDEEDDAPPTWEKTIPKPQQKKEVGKKFNEDKGRSTVDEGPLDDPIAEKLRQQRLVEEADFAAAQELFGANIDLDAMQPKSAKDFDDFATALVNKYLAPHAKSAHYKSLVKAVAKAAIKPLDLQQTKDIETAVAGMRSDKVKEKAAADAAKKLAGKKKTLNVGRSGGSAGLDDYKFDDPLDDDDFM